MQVARRILELKQPGEADSDFARRIGLSPQQISNYRAGSGASVEAVATIITRTNTNPRWLLTGDGPQVHAADADSEQAFRSGAELVTNELRRLLAEVEHRIGPQ